MNATSAIGFRPVGALLLCAAEPEAVRPAAHLLRERLLLAPAGEAGDRGEAGEGGAGGGAGGGSARSWTVLVPEGKPWLDDAEPVDRVLAGWATALAVGVTWPVIALWWDADRTGFTLASGFRRQVGYEWLADGTPVGEDEAMRTFAARLGLDPVLDMESLAALTRPDPDADGRARLLGLIAVLSRLGLVLPAGLTPGEPADRLREAARMWPGAESIEWAGWRDAVRAELDVVESGPIGPWVRGPRARLLNTAQLVAGVTLALWGMRRRSGGWAFAGGVLLAQGALGLAYDRMRARG